MKRILQRLLICTFIVVTPTACEKNDTNQQATLKLANTDFPACTDQAIDPDQDGWGWENEASCRMPSLVCNRRVIPDSLIQKNLAHPGGLMSAGQIKDLAAISNSEDPMKQSALALLLENTPIDYQVRVVTNLRIEYEKTPAMKEQHRLLVEDAAVQAYQQALAFLVTCDDRYAKNSMQILKQWSEKNLTFEGQNAPLEAAWAVASMARAAELLKYTYLDWDLSIESKFLTWITNKLEPQINRQVQWNFNKWHNNWHTSITEAKMQIAILRDDRQGFEEMIQYYDRIIEGREGMHPFLNEVKNDRYLFPTGQSQETCRDIVHAQFAQGSLLQVPEIAWHQGRNLYSKYQDLLIKTMEYHAPIIRGEPLPKGTINLNLNSTDYGKPCVLKWVGFQPTWEIGLHHFRNRLGLSLPETERTLNQFRPERYTFHWGLGTLTHYRP